MKTKLISAWNNVKYGKNGWTNAGDIFRCHKSQMNFMLSSASFWRQGFSKNSPVWLLGLAYHRKLVVGPSDSESGSPVGNKVRSYISPLFPVSEMKHIGYNLLQAGHYFCRDWLWHWSLWGRLPEQGGATCQIPRPVLQSEMNKCCPIQHMMLWTILGHLWIFYWHRC